MPTPKVKQFTSWSYSQLHDYQECALKAKLKHLDKIKEPKGPALINGQVVHKEAEDFITGKLKKLPESLERFKEEFKELRKKNRAVQVEVDAAFTKDWIPTTWDDWTGCWLRGKLDVLWVQGDRADVRDWKTGKVRPENVEQLSLYALAVFILYPAVEVVDAKLSYLDQGEEIVQTYTRQLDLKRLQDKWTKAPAKMVADTRFDPSPGNHCRYCWFSQSSKVKGGPGLCSF